MKLFCPNCNTLMSEENMNVNENICVCSTCNEVFRLSEIMDNDTVDKDVPDKNTVRKAEDLLSHPPEGAWAKNNDTGQVIVGVSAHSKDAVVFIVFAFLFSGASFFGYSQISKTANIVFSLFMMPFIFVSFFLIKRALYSLFGRVEITFTEDRHAHVFIGMGRSGKRYDINLKAVKKIFRAENPDLEGHLKKEITIEEEKTIKIPLTHISEAKADFLLLGLELVVQL